ncbi:hypothetical protein TNCV_1199401 [Trichonephila clavipes]|uniref:Uncharacterized protein n=1 Tax=Trichonephila clavipes TaxID=2585209 RepID=A0A8X6V480_TRICX|nr:hypothetical protein TNCV_1199401 [Trichonephila clavipes]
MIRYQTDKLAGCVGSTETTRNDTGMQGRKYRSCKQRTWEVQRGKFYDPVRSLLKSKNQEINRLQLAVKLPWAIFFESVDILS